MCRCVCVYVCMYEYIYLHIFINICPHHLLIENNKDSHSKHFSQPVI